VSADHWIYVSDPAVRFNRVSETINYDPGMAPLGCTGLCAEMARDGAARTTGDGSACYRMRGANTSRITMAAAMEPSSAAVDASGMHAAATHAAAVKSAATATEASTATPATPREGIVGDQASGEQNDYCKSSENIAEHDGDLPRNSPTTGKCGARPAGG
jgi:hypothetical protein